MMKAKLRKVSVAVGLVKQGGFLHDAFKGGSVTNPRSLGVLEGMEWF